MRQLIWVVLVVDGVREGNIRSQDEYEENYTWGNAEEESVECAIAKPFQDETGKLYTS